MDGDEVRASWQRAAARAASSARQGQQVGAPVLPDGVPTFARAPFAVEPDDLAGADVAVLGLPFGGAGPAAVRRQSACYSLRQGRCLVPHTGDGVVVLDRLRVVDYGDVAVVPGDARASFTSAHDKLADVFAAGATPIVLGGDHSITIPVLQVLAAKLTGKLGVVAFDAHFDLGFTPRYAAGSQWARALELGVLEPANFVQVGLRGVPERLVEKYVADELGHRYYTMAEIDEAGIATVAQEALEVAATGTEAVYLSLDLAVLDPGCGAPPRAEPAGLTVRELLRALRTLSRGGRVAGLDVCSVAPGDDPQGHLGPVAARAVLEVIAGLAVQGP